MINDLRGFLNLLEEKGVLRGPSKNFPEAVTQQPVFKLKVITHRRNPIYVTALTGPPTTDNHVMKEVIQEAIS
jgi:UbiD family decarboxylase